MRRLNENKSALKTSIKIAVGNAVFKSASGVRTTLKTNVRVALQGAKVNITCKTPKTRTMNNLGTKVLNDPVMPDGIELGTSNP